MIIQQFITPIINTPVAVKFRRFPTRWDPYCDDSSKHVGFACSRVSRLAAVRGDDAPRNAKTLEPVAVRHEFLSLTDPQVHDFLTRTGIFYPLCLGFRDLQAWQMLIRALMVNPLEKWATLPDVGREKVEAVLSLPAPRAKWSGTTDMHGLELWTASTLAAIVTLIRIEQLSGAKFRLCSSSYCRRPFEASDPRKIYCSQTCGNRESMRRTRKNGRKLRVVARRRLPG
jgi:hypothetical protein